MEVTGWTYFDNPNYINISYKLMELKAEALKVLPKLPTITEIKTITKDELNQLLADRTKQMEEAINTKEIHDMNNLLGDIIAVVIEDVRKNNYHFSGSDHQQADFGTPIIDNKYILCMSMRAWGELIAEAFPNEIDNSNGLGYIKWAFCCPDDVKSGRKIPKKKLVIK